MLPTGPGPQSEAPPRLDMAACLACAHRLADLSAAAIMPHFRQALAVEDKNDGNQRESGGGSFDPVTVADRAAEAVIRAELARTFPEHGILGEEMANDTAHRHRRWIIDPIDGTRAFIMGLPLWGTLIGLADGTTPVLGLMNQPFTGERFWSEAEASWWSMPQAGGASKRRLATRTGLKLGEAILSSTHPDLFKVGHEAERFAELRSRVRMTRYGGDCYGYAMVAMGLIDLVVEAGLKPFDIAALIPIIERAGGRVTAWDGRPALEARGREDGGGRIIAAGDPRLHEQAVRILAG